MKSTKTLFAFLAALIFSCQAQAIVIESGDVFDVDWTATTTNGSTLNASSTWTVTSFSTTQILLAIAISNDTSTTDAGQDLSNAAILSFGFGIDPDATAAITTAGTTFDMVSDGQGANQTFPGGFKEIDVCIFSDGCAGGDINTGLQAGESDSLAVTLTGTFSTSAELFFFPLKFQTSNGSYEPGGCVDGEECYNVPAPAILGVMGIGLMGMVFSSGLRRRKIS